VIIAVTTSSYWGKAQDVHLSVTDTSLAVDDVKKLSILRAGIFLGHPSAYTSRQGGLGHVDAHLARLCMPCTSFCCGL
jgi:hypothetical protein